MVETNASVYHRLGVCSGSLAGSEKAKQYLNLLGAEGCPFFAFQWNILAISVLFKLSLSLIHLETHQKKILLNASLFALTWFWKFSYLTGKKNLAWKNNFQLSFSGLWKLWERGSTELSKIQGTWWNNKPPHTIPASRMWYTQIALCCRWLRHGLVWPTLYEIFVPNVSRGWLLAFRGALPIETLSSRSEEAAWIWTEVPNTFILWCSCNLYHVLC